MHGNTLGVTSNQQDVLRNNLSHYLTSLEEKGYPYDKVSLQFSGYVTDNSPPSTKVCDIIREWNEKYAWPKLRSALASEFMMYLDEQHGDDIPEARVAWPDWWTDGVASAANETKEVRNAHVKVGAITTLMAMGKLLGADLPPGYEKDLQEVNDNLLFYDEHTHGAAESVRDPLAQNTINQWGMKSAYAWDAAKQAAALEEKALAFIEPKLGRSDVPTIAVFNTLNWERSGMAQLFIQNAIVPEGADFTITDENGDVVHHQLIEQRQEGAYFNIWVEDVPPVGYKVLQVNNGVAGTGSEDVDGDSFENQYYRIDVDHENRVITQIFDKELNMPLLASNDSLTIGRRSPILAQSVSKDQVPAMTPGR